MSEGTNVGTIHLGVELEDIQEKIGDALAKATGKIKPISSKKLGSSLGSLADKATDSVEDTTVAVLQRIEHMVNVIVEKLQSINIPQVAMEPFEQNESRLNGLAPQKIQSPRGPPLKVDLSPEIQIKQLEDQLLLIDQKWESLDASTRRHFDTLDDLKAQYAELEKGVLIGGESYKDNSALMELGEAISKIEAKAFKGQESLIGLEHASERTRAKIAELAEGARETAAELESLPDAESSPLYPWSGMIDSIKNKFISLGSSIKSKLNNTLHDLKNKITGVGNAAHSAGNRGGNAFDFMGRSLKQALKRVLIMATLYKAIRAFIGYVRNAAMASEGFAASLNSIKINLAAAFQPIINVVIPILNALASALATVTAYIAAFVAMLFGTTYSASVKGAKGLKAQTDALNDVGGAAGGAGGAVEKLKRALAGFDEINTLDIPEDSGGGGGGGGGGGWETSAEAVLGDSALFDGLKNILERIWGPFKGAWENEGQPTIEAAKFAFKEILGLLAAIGDSMLTVWENGTGQIFLESILRTLQNILITIGLIARDFKDAWVEDGRGTQIIQNIADGFNNLQSIVESVTDSVKNVWLEMGGDTAKAILIFIESLSMLWEEFTGKLRSLWDSKGKAVFENLLSLILQAGIFISFLWTEYFGPFISMFIDIFGAAFGVVLDLARPLINLLVNFLNWLMGDGKPILEGFMLTLLVVGTAFGIVQGAVFAFNTVMSIGTVITTLATGAMALLGAAFAFITSPIGIAIVAVSAVIAIFLIFREKVEAVSEWCKEHLGILGDVIGGIFDGIGWAVDKVAGIFSSLFPKDVETGTDNSLKSVEELDKGISKNFDSITKKTGSTFDSFEKKASTSSKNFANTVDKNTKTGTDAMSNHMQKSLSGMEKDINSYMPKMGSNYSSEIEKMLSGTQTNMNSIENVFDSTTSNLSSNVPNAFQGLNKDSTKEIDNLVKSIDTSMKNMDSTTSKYVTQMVTKVETSFTQLSKSTTEKMKQMQTAIESGMQKVANTSTNTANSIQSAFNRVNLYSVGQNIVAGLWSGMSSREWWLYSNLSAMVSRTISTVKSAYAIRSPSKVFEKEIGAMLPEGAAIGVRKNTGVFEDALEDMATIPEIEQPVLFNVGRSTSSVQAAQEEIRTDIFKELLALFKEMKNDKEGDHGDLSVSLMLDDGTVLAKTVLKEFRKMSKQDPQFSF